jgi:biopolymer transport protein ExbD
MKRHAVASTAYEPRIEMTPLLDVIFLLLTFFIYSLVLTVRAQVLPVNLPTLTAGQVPAEAEIAAITVDAAGDFYLNARPLNFDALKQQLADLGRRDKPPVIFIALDAKAGDVDRGPTLIRLIDTLRKVGLPNFYIVGQQETPGKSDAP